MTVVDATFGEGGHSEKMLEKIGESGRLVAIDLDKKAGENFENIIKKKNSIFIQGNFKDIDELLKKESIGKVDFILADLGWRMEQIRDERYGLSFSSQTSLSMRLDGDQEGLTAEKIVNEWPIRELAKIFRDYGEEKQAFLAAKAIQRARKDKRIVSAKDLAEILNSSLGRFYSRSKLHPATKVFQALRIFVNRELENLEIFLEKATSCLNEGGRLVVITFHSGEDRIVKNFFRANARGCVCPPEFPKCICGREPELVILTTQPVFPSVHEVSENPRSRSAKLRVAEKI